MASPVLALIAPLAITNTFPLPLVSASIPRLALITAALLVITLTLPVLAGLERLARIPALVAVMPPFAVTAIGPPLDTATMKIRVDVTLPLAAMAIAPLPDLASMPLPPSPARLVGGVLPDAADGQRVRTGQVPEGVVRRRHCAPSRLIATREKPVSAIFAATRSVTSVPLVASAIRNPVSTP